MTASSKREGLGIRLQLRLCSINGVRLEGGIQQSLSAMQTTKRLHLTAFQNSYAWHHFFGHNMSWIIYLVYIFSCVLINSLSFGVLISCLIHLKFCLFSPRGQILLALIWNEFGIIQKVSVDLHCL